MKRIFKKSILAILTLALLIPTVLTGCSQGKEKVLIYSTAEDYRLEYLGTRLKEEFPDYDVTIEYMGTGSLAAKLLAEGTGTEGDICYSLEYGYLAQLDEKDLLADLSDYDMTLYTEDAVKGNYIPDCRNGGAILINPEVLADKGLDKPTSYEDLLDPAYAGLISMPSPKSSGTGYMFLKALVNEWGEDEALAYFDALTPNILQYTSSGSGPVNALIQGEVAIGLGMTSQAVTQINEGKNLEILYFEEGSPYSLYGSSITKGKETRDSVKEVFDFLATTYIHENTEKFFPEKILRDKDYTVENYPQNIVYSDMNNDTIEEKTILLEKWKY